MAVPGQTVAAVLAVLLVLEAQSALSGRVQPVRSPQLALAIFNQE